MWAYKVFNNSKLKMCAIIKDDLSGVRLEIPYDNLSHMSVKARENIVKTITNKLNQIYE